MDDHRVLSSIDRERLAAPANSKQVAKEVQAGHAAVLHHKRTCTHMRGHIISIITPAPTLDLVNVVQCREVSFGIVHLKHQRPCHDRAEPHSLEIIDGPHNTARTALAQLYACLERRQRRNAQRHTLVNRVEVGSVVSALQRNTGAFQRVTITHNQ